MPWPPRGWARTVRHLAINGGYIVVGLTDVGTILGAFRPHDDPPDEVLIDG